VINRKDIPQLVGLPGGGIATNCPICKSLEEACESRLSEYVKPVRVRITRSVQNSRPIRMSRWSARRANWKSIGLFAFAHLNRDGQGPIIQESRRNLSGKEARQSELGKARTEYRSVHGRHLIRRGRQAAMPVPSAVWQFGPAQGLGPKEQGSQIRATRFTRIMGFRSQRIVVMSPCER
jgi:hypothetical protein